MALHNSRDNDNSSAEEDELYGENGFSGWRKNDSLLSDLMGNPFVWGCGIAFAMIVLLFIFWPKSDENEAVAKIESLAQKIEMLENRVFILESSFENAAIKSKSADQPIKVFEERIQQLEASVNQRTEKVNGALQVFMKRLTALEERPVPPPTQVSAKPPEKPAAPAKTEKPKPKPAPEKSPEKYHTVVQGDTLYSIGRKYEISVEKLMEVNGIGQASPIVPGQKLKVTP